MIYTKMFRPNEIEKAVSYLRYKAFVRDVWYSRRNLALFRLLVSCGLRIGEGRLVQRNMLNFGSVPTLTVPKNITKGKDSWGKARVVPLNWDRGGLEDLYILTRDLDPNDYVHRLGVYPGGERSLHDRWQRLMVTLFGEERGKQLTSHAARHTFITYNHWADRPLIEIMRAAGHTSLNRTQIYMHSRPESWRDIRGAYDFDAPDWKGDYDDDWKEDIGKASGFNYPPADESRRVDQSKPHNALIAALANEGDPERRQRYVEALIAISSNDAQSGAAHS